VALHICRMDNIRVAHAYHHLPSGWLVGLFNSRRAVVPNRLGTRHANLVSIGVNNGKRT